MVISAAMLMAWRKTSNDSDNDTDHSFNQPSVHTALTCLEGKSAWALTPSLFGEKKFAPCRHNSSRCSC